MSASTTVSTVLAASLLAGAVALTGPVAAGSAASGGAADHRCAAQFDRAVERYVATTDARDADGFNQLLHSEVTAVLPGGYTLLGRTEVAGFIDGFFARTDWTQTLEVRHTAVSGCDTALVLFDSVYTDGDGAVPLAIVITWTHERGAWQVIVDQNTVVGS